MDGFTALHLAAGYGKTKTAQALLAAGADVQAKTKTKRKRSAGSTAKFLELAQAAAQERVAGQL